MINGTVLLAHFSTFLFTIYFQLILLTFLWENPYVGSVLFAHGSSGSNLSIMYVFFFPNCSRGSGVICLLLVEEDFI